MPTHSAVAQAEGRKRTWTAPNGASVVLPVLVSAWEDHEITGERMWTITARVDLIDKVPRPTDLHVNAPDGLEVERLQRDLRWATPTDIVTAWVPEILAGGGDPFRLEPPIDWWMLEGRRELTDEFLAEVSAEYLRLGRGYAKPMAIQYRTTERTIKSWIDKARERGILGPSAGRGRLGVKAANEKV